MSSDVRSGQRTRHVATAAVTSLRGSARHVEANEFLVGGRRGRAEARAAPAALALRRCSRTSSLPPPTLRTRCKRRGKWRRIRWRSARSSCHRHQWPRLCRTPSCRGGRVAPCARRALRTGFAARTFLAWSSPCNTEGMSPYIEFGHGHGQELFQGLVRTRSRRSHAVFYWRALWRAARL